jgi:hypothetical protein
MAQGLYNHTTASGDEDDMDMDGMDGMDSKMGDESGPEDESGAVSPSSSNDQQQT